MTHPAILTDEAMDTVHGGSEPEIIAADDSNLPIRLQVRINQRIRIRKTQLIHNGARIAYHQGELEEFRDNVREVTGMGGG